MTRSHSPDRPAILSTPAKSVTNFKDDELAELIVDMIDTLQADPICVGLAAPQLGVDLRVAVVCPSRKSTDITVIINPTSVQATGQKDLKRESCMSLPNQAGSVERRKKLRVTFSDEDGETTDAVFQGFAARVVAHEIDHLEGIMYCDKAVGPLIDMDFDAVRKKLVAEA